MELEFDIIQEQKHAVGGFVNFITRYPICKETIYLLNDEFDLQKMRVIDAKFEFGLPKELAKYNSPDILKDDIVNFLLAYIQKYSDWYELHQTEIKEFEKTTDENYYTLFYNMYNGTRKYVERLFNLNLTEPESNIIKLSRLSEFDPFIVQKIEPLIEAINFIVSTNKISDQDNTVIALKEMSEELEQYKITFKLSFSKILDAQTKDDRQIARIKNKTLPLISKFFSIYQNNKDETENYTHSKDNLIPYYIDIIYCSVLSIKEEINICLNLKATEPDEPETIYPDYSETTYSEKYVMLHQLGIIDYLRETLKKQPGLTYTHGNLASLITSFTGMDYENLRRDINATYTGDKDHRNKITDRNIEKAKIKLYSLKIKPETFNIK